jgi:hypothetical protein
VLIEPEYAKIYVIRVKDRDRHGEHCENNAYQIRDQVIFLLGFARMIASWLRIFLAEIDGQDIYPFHAESWVLANTALIIVSDTLQDTGNFTP